MPHARWLPDPKRGLSRSWYNEIMIIASTGLISSPMANEALNLGVNAFLKKPYDADNLLKTVNDVLHP